MDELREKVAKREELKLHEEKVKKQEKIENDIATALSKLVGSAAEKVISTVSNVAGVIGSAVISAGRAILGWLGF